MFAALACFGASLASADLPASQLAPTIAQPFSSAPLAYRPPELIFEHPPEMAAVAEMLRAQPAEGYLRIQRLLRLEDPGPPIRVLVAPEGSPPAKLAPEWALAYAIGKAGTVVMIPSRVPRYPDGDLLGVLRHEVAHVLIARAAGREHVPRYFDEGLALYAAREWRWEDRGRVFLASWPLSGVRLARLDDEFAGGDAAASRAYAISGSVIRYLIEEEGEGVVPRLLHAVARGRSWDDAFAREVGVDLPTFEDRFWGNLDLWQKWVPLLTSSTTAWLGITLLAMAAFERRRRRDAAQRERWLLEEEAEAGRLVRIAPLSDEEDEEADHYRPPVLG